MKETIIHQSPGVISAITPQALINCRRWKVRTSLGSWILAVILDRMVQRGEIYEQHGDTDNPTDHRLTTLFWVAERGEGLYESGVPGSAMRRERWSEKEMLSHVVKYDAR